MIKLLSSDATINFLVAMEKKKTLILITFLTLGKKNVVIIPYFFLCVYRPLNSVIGLVSSQLDPS